MQQTQNYQNSLEKNKAAVLKINDFKIYYTTMVIKAVWYGHKYKRVYFFH